MAPGAGVFQGVRKESAAFRLMKQMGWEEGSGLGKDNQGIKKHLVVKKKDDNGGVGSNEVHNWTFNTTEFDSLLKKLKVQVTDKPEQTEGSQKKKQSDESHSESEESESEKEESPKKLQKVSRPQGRYKRIERGKMVQNYSKEDLKSILGVTNQKSEKQVEKAKHTVSFVAVELSQQEQALISANPPADWWGNKFGFVKAGTLGSSSNCTTKDSAFTENDQEKLYNSVHDKATKGRGGLGIADRAKKLGGAHWKGQKTSFDDEVVEEAPIETKRKREIGDEGDAETRSKWKKICKEFLMQAPDQKSSLKKLHKHVASAVGIDSLKDIDGLRKKLSKSSRFTIDGNRVYLTPEVAA